MLSVRFALCALAFLASAAPALADGTVLRAKGCGDKLFVSGADGTFSVLVTSEAGIARP